MPANDKMSRHSKQIVFLTGIAVMLALVYLLTLFYNPERVAARNAAFTWLSAEARDRADSIAITRPGAETLALARKNGVWFAEVSGEQVPVKQGRIDDLFRILAGRGAFPRLGSSASSHAELGLSPDTAIRLAVRSGADAQPLLDILIGADDTAGRDVYLRKNGENEYRSGNRLIKTYANGEGVSWYNLRLFDETENRADLVQRLRISPLKDGEGDENFVLVKDGPSWVIEGHPETPLTGTAENWVRSLFEIQGDDFLPRTDSESLVFNAAVISIELGNGSGITVQAADERDGKWPVMVSGSPYVYLLSRPAFQRLFRKRSTLT
jgi:hypothetical protein